MYVTLYLHLFICVCIVVHLSIYYLSSQPSVAVSIPSACSLSPHPPTSLSFLSLCSAPSCSICLSVSTTACPLALLPSLALACCHHCLSSGIGGMHSLTQSLKDAVMRRRSRVTSCKSGTSSLLTVSVAGAVCRFWQSNMDPMEGPCTLALVSAS
jgi:hypothetical protein